MAVSSSISMNFRKVLLRIGQEISQRDLENLKFACREPITESRMERMHSAKDVFLVLEEKGLLSPDKLEYIARQLIDIGRPQLLSHFEAFGFHIPDSSFSTPSSFPPSSSMDPSSIETQFNRCLLALSQKLNSEEVDRLAFAWCGTHILITPDKIYSAHQLFTLMSQRMILKPDNLHVLYIEFSEMGRLDLCRMIEDYFHVIEFGRHYHQGGGGSGHSSPSPSPCPPVYGREDHHSPHDQFYNQYNDIQRPTNLSISSPPTSTTTSATSDLSYNMSQLHLQQNGGSPHDLHPYATRKESTDNYSKGSEQFRPLSASNDGSPNVHYIVPNGYQQPPPQQQGEREERNPSIIEIKNAQLAVKEEELQSLQKQLEIERAQKQPTESHIQEIHLLQEALRAKNTEVNELREVITQIPQTMKQQSSCIRTGDLYPMHKTPHGICLIINNHKFYQVEERYELLTDRSGAQRDQENLVETFNALQYTVELHENLTSEGMVDVFKEISCRDHSNYDSFVCCILTHGEEGHVFGSDSKPVSLQDLTGIMKATFTRSLINKPKLFFVQACRGDGEEKGVPIEKDGNASLPVEADFLFGYATPTGKAAYRSRRHGSWFISELCQVFMQDSRTLPLGAMMKKVNCKVSDAYTKEGYKQCTEVVDRLRKDVLFFSGPAREE